MEGYTERPSDKVWADICSKAGLKDGRKTGAMPVWIWKCSAAAAAAVAGAILFFNVNEHDTDIRTAEAEVPGIAATEKVQAHDDTQESYARQEVTESILREVPSIRSVSGQVSGIEVSSIHGPESVGTDAASLDSESSEVQADDSMADAEEPRLAKAKASLDKDINEDNGNDAEAWERLLAEDKETKRSTRGKFSTGLAVGGSGSGNASDSRPNSGIMGANPLESGTSSAFWLDSSLEKNAGYLVFNQPELTTTYSHKMPVKVGVTVRYDFSRVIGIETGITWSLLTSDLKTGEESAAGSWSKGLQSLHYFGIPLNISFNLFSSRYFNAYITAGGMMEKCFRGTLKTDEYVNGAYHNSSSASVRPSGLQWSVNGAAGIQLNILPQLGIYMEPGIRHHFSNGSGIRSIYTDKPTDFSLGFGIRYMWSGKH